MRIPYSCGKEEGYRGCEGGALKLDHTSPPSNRSTSHFQHLAEKENITVADLRGGREGRAPPLGVEILSISCSFGKIWRNRMLAPPWKLAPPPRGNPGSATVL